MNKKSFVCEECGKKFRHPAHLGRHRSAMHGAIPKTAPKAGPKATKKSTKKKLGRPLGTAKRHGLSTMAIDDLASLIREARQEIARRLQAYAEL